MPDPIPNDPVVEPTVIAVKPDAILDPRFGAVPAELAALDDLEADPDALPDISEVGKTLPIGYRDQTGKKHATFDLVDWDWEVEEALGELAEQNQDMPMGVYISEIIGTGLRVLGEIDFTKLNRGHRRLVVSNLYHADALYIYIWIRIAALGAQIGFDKFKCERCRRDTDFAGDLRTLEVKGHVGEDVPRATVALDRPFAYGKLEVSKVVVGPLRWAFMETDDVSILTNPAKFRIATLRFGVTGLEGLEEGVPVVLTREHAKRIGPGGVNRIVKAIDELGGGAVMECVGQCISCRTEFRKAIDWTYDNFFGRSSR
jgi:hypothetical protein